MVDLIATRTGAKVPKRQVEELTVRAAQDFDAFYSDRLTEAERTDDHLTLKNRKRMAQVATIYTLAPWTHPA